MTKVFDQPLILPKRNLCSGLVAVVPETATRTPAVAGLPIGGIMVGVLTAVTSFLLWAPMMDLFLDEELKTFLFPRSTASLADWLHSTQRPSLAHRHCRRRTFFLLCQDSTLDLQRLHQTVLCRKCLTMLILNQV